MAEGRPILIVDNDPVLRGILAEQLDMGGEFVASHAASLAEAQRLLDGADPLDALIIDVTLPDGDGRALCTTLRAQGVRVPIILLLAAETDTAKGLEAGASDCIAKPFRIGELLARLRTQMRQFDAIDDSVLALAGYIFRPAAKTLEDPMRGLRIRLTEKEAAMLKFLHRAQGHAVPRGVLLDEVWGYNAAVTTHTLETHIYRLRQKIEVDPSNARILLTEGGGYRLDVAG